MQSPAVDSSLERSETEEDSQGGRFSSLDAASPATSLSREERSIHGVGGRIWVIAARMVGILGTIAANIVAGRYLTQADFGELSIVWNLVVFGSLIAGAGLNRTLVRLIAERLADRDREGTKALLHVGQRVLYLSLIVTAVLFAIVITQLGDWFTERSIGVGLAVAAAAVVLTFGWHQVVGELLRGLHAVRLAALFGAPPWAAGPVVGTIAVTLILALAVTGQLTVAAFLWANALAALVVWPVVVWGLRRAEDNTLVDYPHAERSLSAPLSGSRLYWLCLPIIFTQLLMYLANQSDVWVAGWTCPLDQVGLYGAAKRIVSVIALPLQFSQLTAIASIAHLYARGQRSDLQRILQGAALLAFVPSTIITIAVLLVPEFLLTTLYKPEYAAAAPLLQLLAIGNWVNVATGMSGLTLIMTGHEKIALPVNLFSVAFLVIAGQWAATQFGIIGLAGTMCLALALTYVGSWALTRYYVGVWVHPSFSRDAWQSLVGKIRKIKK